MSDNLTLVAIGLIVAIALLLCYWLAVGINRKRIVRSAERTARSLANDQEFMRANPKLRDCLERYRTAKVRANLGASSTLHAAAAELVREHRLTLLERE